MSEYLYLILIETVDFKVVLLNSEVLKNKLHEIKKKLWDKLRYLLSFKCFNLYAECNRNYKLIIIYIIQLSISVYNDC
jgi:hypothetical protein